MRLSWLFDIDSYSTGHYQQYPPKMTYMFSYMEARGGIYPYSVFMMLQYIIKEYLTQRITMDDVLLAQKFYKAHGVPFNYDGWRHIAIQCQGYLPVKIKAVPEGSIIPTGNVLLTVESTDTEVPWIVSWIEDILVRLWYPCTVATLSREIKKNIYSYLVQSSDDPDSEIDHKLHDFGSRGCSSQETAGIGGASHLVNFLGTDTIAGIQLLRHYYSTLDLKEIPGFSIPASAHTTITSWGKENESLAYENMIAKYKSYPAFACVSDSYDLNNAIKIWGSLKDKLGEGFLVVRPDSGDPDAVVLNTVKNLDKEFGSYKNQRGYKVLNKVRVIQGDGINADMIDRILRTLDVNNYSATNIAFGMGGALLQKVERDNLGFVYKCSHAIVDGKSIDVRKLSPGKVSKVGKLGLVLENGNYVTKRDVSEEDNLLKTVFLDGRLTSNTTVKEIRHRARIPRLSWKDTEVEVRF